MINSCETDPQFPQEAQKVADEILGGGKFAPGYERTYWDGCTHGFAVRGNLVSPSTRLELALTAFANSHDLQSDPKVKAGKEGAFEATIKFYNKYKDL